MSILVSFGEAGVLRCLICNSPLNFEGCMSDPWKLQGLAHFLEHMLFMGTKKYPEENAFEKVSVAAPLFVKAVSLFFRLL